MVYNVPGRTSFNLLPETMARLAEFPNIVAIKEATGDLKQCAKTLELCGDKITVLSGDDFTMLPLLCHRRHRRHLRGLQRRAPATWPACAPPSPRATWQDRPETALQDVAPDGGHVL